MTSLTTPEQINTFRLIALRGAVKLEAIGMKRRGRSATSIAKEMLGLAKGTKAEALVAALDKAIENAKAVMDDVGMAHA